MDLAEFLIARIAEDEAAAVDWRYGWHAKNCDNVVPDADDGECGVCDCGVPARVLAECDAKRQVIAMITDPWWATELVRDQVLGLLALPYSSHRDYQARWAPLARV